MAKRFTDTDKYKKPFIRGLQGAYKLLWDYLYHDCNNAGIWIVDFEIAQIYLGKDMPVNREDALKIFNTDEQKIIEIDQGKKWFIRPFVEFQYGELCADNRAHKSVINQLSQYNLWKTDMGLVSPLEKRKDKDKDKDKDEDKEKGYGGKQKTEEIPFGKFWNLYDKKVDRAAAEQKWNKLNHKEQQDIIAFLPVYITSTPDKTYRKDPATFLNRRAWENEIVTPINHKKIQHHDSDFD